MEKKEKIEIPEYDVSGIQQHEDVVLKTSMQFFADELLPYLNIDGKVVSFAPTEIVYLELKKLYQDFNFVMDDGTWKHFEFQSTNGGIEDLKRFRAYEAITSYQHKVAVETYVLFSGQIKNPMTEFKEGINMYKIHPIIMQDSNADELLETLERKQKSGEIILKSDLIPLVLCPLMKGNSSQKERFHKAYQITRNAIKVKKEDTAKIEAMLYAMADKFLDMVDFEKLKEEIAMTRLGQWLWEEWRAEGKAETINKLLEKFSKEEVAEMLDMELEEVEKASDKKME